MWTLHCHMFKLHFFECNWATLILNFNGAVTFRPPNPSSLHCSDMAGDAKCALSRAAVEGRLIGDVANDVYPVCSLVYFFGGR